MRKHKSKQQDARTEGTKIEGKEGDTRGGKGREKEEGRIHEDKR